MMVELEDSELEELIGHIHRTSGFSFDGYARASLRRRVSSYLIRHQLDMPQLRERVEAGGEVVYSIIQELTVNYSEMFRDPPFFTRIRTEVIGYLASFPAIKIWVAGCASGEEVYSYAIMLKEAGLLSRSLIYATDLSNKALSLAREGAYSLGNMRRFSENYLQSKGGNSLSDYYNVVYNQAVINVEMGERVVFSLHDLTGDGVFNEFQWISCRNVMIYFTPFQRKRVFELLYDSLAMFGFLCLGKRETLRYSGLEGNFRIIDGQYNIYQKIG